MQKPNSNEHAPYFSRYIDLVGEGDFFVELNASFEEYYQLFGSLSIEKQNYRYDEGKWTPKEMLMHIIDTERIFCYRALVISRNDKTALPGFDENAYADNIDVSNRNMSSLLEEFKAVRQATQSFFQNLPEENSSIIGNANNFPTSPRAIAFMIIGHVIHHGNILKERYL